ncbi:aspartate aminotransferase family protein [Paenibacillus jamilae]|uniref:aminotransferase family protein n=1 Tax=Paenibacillus jamilae TaxID=114136 RepID=UPI003D28798E
MDKKTIGELREADRRYVLHPMSSISEHLQKGPGLIVKEGYGIYLKDFEGKQYIDAMSGAWNVNIGHGRKELAEAAVKQMNLLPFASTFVDHSHEPVIRLVEKLASITPGDLNVSFFTSGGSESADSAIKIVRNYWKLKGKEQKTKIIGLRRAYHGLTVGATSLTDAFPARDFSTSNAPGFLHAEPHLTECELGDKSQLGYESSIRGIIEQEGADTIAAVILEPVQGAGGVNISPDGYLQAIRSLCDELDILMITDEIVCGFGRTGAMFGVNHWDVVPDLMLVAKGITSGYFPLGAVLIREKIVDEMGSSPVSYFIHGYTYSGHPVGAAVALKNIEIIEQEGLVDNAKYMGAEFLKGFYQLQKEHPEITNIRFKGLVGAFEIMDYKNEGVPFEKSTIELFNDELDKRGMLTRSYGNSCLFAPPLIINKQEVEDIINIFSDSFDAWKKKF